MSALIAAGAAAGAVMALAAPSVAIGARLLGYRRPASPPATSPPAGTARRLVDERAQHWAVEAQLWRGRHLRAVEGDEASPN